MRHLNYVFCRAKQDANKNRLYVHEVFVSDKRKKGDTLQTAASKPHGGISLYRDILANVLETVAKTEPQNPQMPFRMTLCVRLKLLTALIQKNQTVSQLFLMAKIKQNLQTRKEINKKLTKKLKSLRMKKYKEVYKE